eukprot:6198978-Prymnesium_polylepis.1
MAKAISQSDATPDSPSGATKRRTPRPGSDSAQVQLTESGSTGGAPKISSTVAPTASGSPSTHPATELEERTTRGQLDGVARKRCRVAGATGSAERVSSVTAEERLAMHGSSISCRICTH